MKLFKTISILLITLSVAACGGSSSPDVPQQTPTYTAPNTSNSPAGLSVISGEGYSGTTKLTLSQKGTIVVPQANVPEVKYTGNDPIICFKPDASAVSTLANVTKVGNDYTFKVVTIGGTTDSTTYYIFDTTQGSVPMKVVASAAVPAGIVDDGKTQTYSYPYTANDFRTDSVQGSGVFAGCLTASKLAVRSFKMQSVQFSQGVAVDANGVIARFVGTEIFSYTQPDVNQIVGGQLLLIDVAGL